MNREAIYTYGTGKSTLNSMEGSSPSTDNHVPGPNAYTLPGTNNSPNWRIGKSLRNIIQKQYGAPVGTYNPQDSQTHMSSCQYSFGTSQRKQQKLNNLTVNLDYKPSYSLTRPKLSLYSMGYKEDNSININVPAPNAYFPEIIKKPKSLNRQQVLFGTSNRTDFTKNGTVPAVGSYDISKQSLSPKIKVGSSKRPSLSYTRNLCEGDYNISGNIFKVDGGITFGEKTPIIKSKDNFPSPNKYYPVTLTSKASIPFTRSKRLAYKNEASEFPSPGDYNVEKSLEKSIKIPNGPRSNLVDFKANNPGPGTYETLDQKNSTLGVIHPRIIQPHVKEIIRPSPNTYDPSTKLTDRRGSDALIKLTSKRTDFSRSPTNTLGPGAYTLPSSFSKELGKMSRSQRVSTKQSQNPGPGAYEVAPLKTHSTHSRI